ncbi:AraC family transcriptional regulator [Oceanirhabdus sp. W0125-5]|uniref:AraC family transcriptional regulator n=1 Tax=Oceanirhabdus sp. W0125-5 TaxID=2999116 RepID=UPI0022F32EDB|nr:AraC family transcriptional regulator [Oceanirhabdus sp. W0125-5]WBW97860.1 AraC family transcriptional regulator [Oceanirhabdus sp. W0125-5]
MLHTINMNDKTLIECENYYLDCDFDETSGHIHNEMEISLIKDGHGEYVVDGKIIPVDKGDIFIFNNIQRHGLKVTGDAKLINMVIHFEPRFIWSTPNDVFNYKYLSVFYNNSIKGNKLPSGSYYNNKISSLMIELEDEFANKHLGYDLMVKVKLLNILVLLIRYAGEEDTSYCSFRTTDITNIEKVLTFIENNYMNPIKLEDLSKLVFMNPSYFSRFFKKLNGISPIDYLNRYRIHKASTLLVSTTLPILEIAYICGYNNASNFNKSFKQITGLSPSQFRINKII